MAVQAHTGRRRGRSKRAASSGSAGNWWLWVLVAVALALGVFTLTARGNKGSATSSARSSAALSTAAGVDVATRFDERYQNVEGVDKYGVEKQLQEVTTTAFQPAMIAKVEAMYEKVSASPLATADSDGTQVMARSVPIANVTKKLAGNRLEVTIWSATLAGIDGVVTPRVSWVRDRLTLVQQGDAWKVAGLKELEPLVPSTIAADQATAESDFWHNMKGAKFYESRP